MSHQNLIWLISFHGTERKNNCARSENDWDLNERGKSSLKPPERLLLFQSPSQSITGVRSFPLKSFKTQITQSVEAPRSGILAGKAQKENFPFNNNQIWLWMNLGIYFALANEIFSLFWADSLRRRLLRSDKRWFNPRPRRSLPFHNCYRFILHDWVFGSASIRCFRALFINFLLIINGNNLVFSSKRIFFSSWLWKIIHQPSTARRACIK